MIEHQSQVTHKWGKEGEREGGAHAANIILIIMRVSLCCNCSFHDINALGSRKGMHLQRQRLNVKKTEAGGWDNSSVPLKCGWGVLSGDKVAAPASTWQEASPGRSPPIGHSCSVLCCYWPEGPKQTSYPCLYAL